MEVPYIAVQTILFGTMTYFMINFERTASKILYFPLAMCFFFFFFYDVFLMSAM